MSSAPYLHPNATVHLDDGVCGITVKKLNAQETKVRPKDVNEFDKLVEAQSQAFPQVNVALSFAFDRVTQSLNVVMTDKNSGEVVRKISYKHLSTTIHKSEKLNGLLLDQFA
jgi:uncharacterized FlaG/YvyC family protein